MVGQAAADNEEVVHTGIGLAIIAGAALGLAGCGETITLPFEGVVVPDSTPTPADSTVGLWTDGPSMPGPRMRHSAVVFKGDLLVAGGIIGPGTHTASMIRLTPGSDSWEELAPMPYELAGHSLVVVGDTLFALGGDGSFFSRPERALFAYDDRLDEWSVRESIPDSR